MKAQAKKPPQHAHRDDARAVRIAELAWQKGYAKAARQLTWIYNSANDAQNAYFWGLRCIGECRGYQYSPTRKPNTWLAAQDSPSSNSGIHSNNEVLQ